MQQRPYLMIMSNTSCNTNYLSNFPSPIWNYTFGTINAVNAFTAIVENSFVLFIILWYKELCTISDGILISLVITDLLAGCTTSPLYAVKLFSETISLNCTVEEVRRSLGAVLIGASALSVAAISYDRYLRMMKLHNYSQHMTKGKCILLVLLCWVIAGSLPLLRHLPKTEIYYVIAFSTLMALVFLLLIILYFLVLNSLRQRASWRQRSVQIEKQQMRSVKIVILIITVYVLMALPVMIPLILMPLQIDSETMGAIYVSVLTLNNLNSSANPIIYYYRNPFIRKYAKKLLGLDTKSNHDGLSAKARSATVVQNLESVDSNKIT